MTDDLLKSLTECGICWKEFSDPRILSCFHTFCLRCFKQMGEAANKKPGETMPCPLCRKEFTIPAERMDGLQKNFFMQHLLEVTANFQTSDTPTIVCDTGLCKELFEGQEKSKAAKMRCLECRDNFCDICAKAHTLQKLSKGHHVVKIGSEAEEDLRRTLPTRNCGVHSKKALDYYCPQCKKIVCVSCWVENHATHGCKDVNNVEKEFRQIIEVNASKMSIYADEVLPKSKRVDQKKEAILLQLAAIENEIEQRHLELKEMIDKHRATLLEELSLIKQKVVKDCENEKEEIERNHIILKSFETYCTELASKGSASDVCSCVDNLMTKANELERDHEEFIGRPLLTKNVSFSPTDLGRIKDTQNMNIVGRIQETFTQMESCVVIAGLHDDRNLLKDSWKINLQRPQEISAQQQNLIPIKMQNGSTAAVHCNTMYVTGVGDNGDEIWKYNSASWWSKCASLVQGRSEHCAEFIDGILYICGGRLHSKERILKSVEAYNADTSECAIVGKLTNFVHSSGNCVPFRSSLYIFGGSDRNCNSLNKVQVYDTEKNICSLLTTPMPSSNRLMQAVRWETSVILLGCDTCFIFNLETKTWEERKQFKTDVVHFGLALENERMFIIGGGIGTVDDAGNCSWKCRGDVRYVPLKSIIDDKPVEWKSYTKLVKPIRVHCYGNVLFFLDSKTI